MGRYIKCLESIYQINYPNYQVIIVDNNSSDDSILKINDYALGKLEVKSNFFKYDPTDKPIEISVLIKINLIQKNIMPIIKIYF